MSSIKCPLTKGIFAAFVCSDVKKMYKKVCCRSSINLFCFFDVFIAVVVVVVTALYFDLKPEGAQCHDIWKNPKCINLYTVKVYRLLRKCSCLVKRYFLHIKCKCIETFIIEWRHEKSWIFCYLKTQWCWYCYFHLESLLHLEHIQFAENILFFSFFAF